jgi:polyvinyl alcohol dehydrogenase (cytochrome)
MTQEILPTNLNETHLSATHKANTLNWVDMDYKPLLFILYLFVLPLLSNGQDKYWLTGGQNLSNTRNASTETKISPNNAGSLKKNWDFTTGGDVSATPAVDDGSVYFPDWAGNLYRVDAKTGALKWKSEFKAYLGSSSAFARATPAISGNTLIIGTQLANPPSGAYVLGINKMNGNLLWKTKVDDHFAAIVTQSAVVYGNKVYVGVASQEEAFAADPNYPCCSFRGSLVCLDARTGQILWKTYMTPAGNGFSGVAVWGSTPVIDAKRNSVYITTGNNYTVPQEILDIVAVGGAADVVRTAIMGVEGSAQNYFDAIVSLDLTTGAVKWAKSVIPFDAWTVACFFDGPNCPDNAGPDYDFGQGPALFSVGSGSSKRELLGAGQKSGKYWVVNPDNGADVWQTQVGPGGTLGGLQWGSAVDGKQIYTAISNNYYMPHLMTKGPGAGSTVYGGFWAALDAATGAVTWEYAATNPPPFPPYPGASTDGLVANNTGMVTVANGVVFAGAMDAVGTMYAFNAATGEKLWSFESGGSINSGAAVVDGNVYWGSGYSNFGLGTPNNKLYSFGISKPSAREGVELDQAIKTYPNPATQVMNIVSQDQSNIKSIKVYDLAGRLIKEFRAVGSPTYDLDLRTIPKGTYMVNITTSTESITKKVVVSH